MAGRRLTESERREIADGQARGASPEDLAARFGVSRRTVERASAQARSGGPVAQPTGRTLGVWVSVEELRAFDAAIAPLELSRSDAVRRMLRAASGFYADDDARLAAVQELSAAVNRVGNNVNQIARACNEARLMGQPLPYTSQDHAELRDALRIVFAAADQMQRLAQGRREQGVAALARALQADGDHR